MTKQWIMIIGGVLAIASTGAVDVRSRLSELRAQPQSGEDAVAVDGENNPIAAVVSQVLALDTIGTQEASAIVQLQELIEGGETEVPLSTVLEALEQMETVVDTHIDEYSSTQLHQINQLLTDSVTQLVNGDLLRDEGT
jgi:hypothetical protein